MLLHELLVRDLVLIGGGHAHVHVLKALGMRPIPGVQTTLVTRDIDTPYSGMLPGHIAGHYSREECHLDLQKLARFAGARLVHASATGLDLDGRYVHCNDGRPPLPYDCLSLDIGSTPRLPPGVSFAALPRGVTPVKPIDGFSVRWEGIVARVLAAASGNGGGGGGGEATRLVVVGGGAGGVELTLAMQYRLQKALREAGKDPALAKITLLHRGEKLLETHGSRVRRVVERVMAERGVEILAGREAVGVTEQKEEAYLPPRDNGKEEYLPPRTHDKGDGKDENGNRDGRGKSIIEKELGDKKKSSRVSKFIECSDGSRLAFDEAVWCTNSGAAEWLKDTGLRLDESGFVLVDTHLQALGTPGVFAAGDCCHIGGHSRPKAGVFAVRAGPPLAENLRAYLEGVPPRQMREYLPQNNFLGILGTGDKYAVASKGGMALEGANVWRWKDHIDRTWMSGYQHLPEKDNMAMATTSPPPPAAAAAAAAGMGGGEGGSSLSLSAAVVAAGPEAVAAVERAAMRCGGCGSKVGATVLSRVLTRLRQRKRRQRRRQLANARQHNNGGGGCGGGGGTIRETETESRLESGRTIRGGGGGREEENGKYNDSYGEGGSDDENEESDDEEEEGVLGGDDAAVVPLPTAATAARAGLLANGGGGDQRLKLVHTVDYFRSFVSDPFVFGAIAARHALSDVHAMGAVPTTALAVAVVPYAGERQLESCLEQALAGAAKVLDEEGCELVGGHSAEGAELALGFAVNGVVDARHITRKKGARPGDRLILTKAIGTGVVLAADMRGKAAGSWVAAAVASMLAPAAPAAKILREHGARACTDVTGFGLAGHLVEMLRGAAAPAAAAAAAAAGLAGGGTEENNGSGAAEAASAAAAAATAGGGQEGSNGGGGGKTARTPNTQSKSKSKSSRGSLGAWLYFEALPLLPGALECAGGGMLSSLHAENVRAAALIADAHAAADHPLWPLLFDPQTAGPLLAALPAEQAAACVAALRESGGCPEAVVIGEVLALPEGSSGGSEEPKIWAAGGGNGQEGEDVSRMLDAWAASEKE